MPMGASCLAIARELNARGIPSPGSTWKRKARRCKGWMGSAVRVILRNPLYCGRVRWNVSQFVRDPDSGKHQRRRRPKAEWVEHQDESLRIIPDTLFEQAQARTRVAANSDKRLKSGGKAKYLLSGLLICNVCKAHYVIADARSYACSGHWNGGACSNHVRVRRDAIERVILGGVRRDLLAPERVERMAAEMRVAYAERMRELAARAETLPHEIQELDARITRLRERLKAGDPDLMADELQAGIERAENKRRELLDVRPAERENARVLALMRRAAELYREQIDLGLGGDPAAAAKARTILRDMLGEIMLSPGEDGSLWAEYGMQPAALLQGARTCGRVWPGLIVSPETVNQRIKLLRDALGDDARNPRYIAGLRSRGCRLIGPVADAALDQPAPMTQAEAGSPERQSMSPAPRIQSRTRSSRQRRLTLAQDRASSGCAHGACSHSPGQDWPCCWSSGSSVSADRQLRHRVFPRRQLPLKGCRRAVSLYCHLRT